MTMTLDATQQRFGPSMNLDHHQYHHNPSPPFSNPWSSSSSPPQSASTSGMYVGGHQPSSLTAGLLASKQQQAGRPASGAPSLPPYGSMPGPADMMSINRLPPATGAYSDASYSSASPVASQYATSGPHYDGMGYAPAPARPHYGMLPEADRSRAMHQQHAEERRGFADALDASHGMLAMSQETPRPIYGSRTDRSSVDSYGFPSTHSTSSSVSSSGNFSSYYGDSVSDYSTAGSDIESVNSRTLPPPHGLMSSSLPPAPQSMMGQFSSKVSSSTQKKHKCKVCDKRFTRPSSLQTHMYSHTGEKPFACEVEGCGRHFSVVSNLRRHRKVHRGDAQSETGSEDHQGDSD